MTREEAIKSLMRCEAETYCRHYTETFRCDGCNKRKALDMAIKALMAIEALTQESRKVTQEFTQDLISRQDAIAYFFRPYSNEELYSNTDIEKALNALPSADRPKGEWVWDDEDGEYFCNKCKTKQYNNINEIISGEWAFCPHCGADMRGGKNENSENKVR